jgi:aminomethyltransferase
MQRTELFSAHHALGARMIDFGGWEMPVQYGPILEEVQTVRQKGGLFDLGHMGRVAIHGKDRIAFADKLATCRVAKIPQRAIRYGLLCRENGMPIDDILVYQDEDHVFLVVNASNTTRDLEWLRQHAKGFDVRIEDQTDALGMVALQGQISERVLQRLTTGLDLSTVGYYKFAYGTVCGLERMRISRTGYTGEDGFELYVPKGQTAMVWQRLLEVGTELGLKPIGLGARDTLRLEAGMPLYGHEISDELNPIEAGLSFGVSLVPEKASTLGYAALKAFSERPTKQIVGLSSAGPRVPRQGHELYAGQKRVGFICSGSVSPTIQTNIATGYVELPYTPIGTELEIDLKGKRQAVTVRPLPFYSRKR